MKRIAVVGGGLSGLAVSHALLARAEGELELLCLEAAERPGGRVGSSREQGFLCEWGAIGLLDDEPSGLALVRTLGLEPRLVRAREEARARYLFRAGRLYEVPKSPGALLRSGLLPPPALLRLLCEPLVPRRRRAEGESVHAFGARRLGRTAADLLVDALASGVYGGDARALELESAFPALSRMEAEHGSLLRALFARRPAAGAARSTGPAPRGRLLSFHDGLAELVLALSRGLGPRLVFGEAVTRLSHLGGRGIRVHRATGAPLDVDAVVVAAPAAEAAGMLRALDEPLAAALSAIPTVDLAVVHLGFRTGALGPVPTGTGFLVPRGQGVRILGVLWPSQIFEGRAPQGSLLMTAMVGGAHDPEACALDERALLALVRADLETTLGVRAPPYFVRVVRQPRGIPQYTLGHGARVRTIDETVGRLPGLWLAGSSLRGVSLNACLAEAPRIASAVHEFLASRPGVSAELR